MFFFYFSKNYNISKIFPCHLRTSVLRKKSDTTIEEFDLIGMLIMVNNQAIPQQALGALQVLPAQDKL